MFSGQTTSIFFLTPAQRSVTTPAQVLSSLHSPDCLFTGRSSFGLSGRSTAHTRNECDKIRTMALQSHSERLLAVAISLCTAVLAALTQTNPTTPNGRQQLLDKLVAAAIERTNHSVNYVSSYIHLDYPGGDVPAGTGVCSDEIIRAYRAVGVDLQKEVHEDMVHNWTDYPAKSKWHQARPDPNIDHRQRAESDGLFQTYGRERCRFHRRAKDYSPGDLRDLGLGRRCATHRDCCEHEICRERAFPDGSQHRARAEDGRCVVQLEDYWALPVFWATSAGCALTP